MWRASPALILERKPQLSPDAVRALIISTARDLGAPGKDPEFGAGIADAYQAIVALDARTAGSAPSSAPHRRSRRPRRARVTLPYIERPDLVSGRFPFWGRALFLSFFVTAG